MSEIEFGLHASPRICFIFSKILFIYLFIFTQREGKEREISGTRHVA